MHIEDIIVLIASTILYWTTLPKIYQ